MTKWPRQGATSLCVKFPKDWPVYLGLHYRVLLCRWEGRRMLIGGGGCIKEMRLQLYSHLRERVCYKRSDINEDTTVWELLSCPRRKYQQEFYHRPKGMGVLGSQLLFWCCNDQPIPTKVWASIQLQMVQIVHVSWWEGCRWSSPQVAYAPGRPPSSYQNTSLSCSLGWIYLSSQILIDSIASGSNI